MWKLVLGVGLILAAIVALVAESNRISYLKEGNGVLQTHLVAAQQTLTNLQSKLRPAHGRADQDSRALELNRLRARVSSLRRENQRLQAEAAQTRAAQAKAAAAAAASPHQPATTTSASLPVAGTGMDYRMMVRYGLLSPNSNWATNALEQADRLKMAASKLKQFLTDHPDTPLVVDGQPNPELAKLDPNLNLNGVELLLTNTTDPTQVFNHNLSVIARSKTWWPTQDGRYQRVYVRADGSVVTVTYNSENAAARGIP